MIRIVPSRELPDRESGGGVTSQPFASGQHLVQTETPVASVASSQVIPERLNTVIRGVRFPFLIEFALQRSRVEQVVYL